MRRSLFLSAMLVTTLIGGSALADRTHRDRDRLKENMKELAFRQRGDLYEHYESKSSKPKVTRHDYDKTRAYREKSGAPMANDKLQQVGRFEDGDPTVQKNKKKRQSAQGWADKTMQERLEQRAKAVEGMRAYKSMDKGPMLDAAKQGFDEESGTKGNASNRKKARQAEEKTWSDKTMEKREAMKQERLAAMRAYKSMDKGPELQNAREGANGSSASAAAAPDRSEDKKQKQNEPAVQDMGASRSADW